LNSTSSLIITALLLVVATVVIGCESDQRTNTAPSVVTVGTVYANMTATVNADPVPTAVAQPTMTNDELLEWVSAMNTVTSATQTAMQKRVSGGQVITIDEWGPEFDLYDRREWSLCDEIELDRCVTIQFQDSKTWATYQITTPVWGDCYDGARFNGYVSSRGPCGEYWSTLWKVY